MKRVLWIEDGAETEVPHLAGPVHTSGQFFLHEALNATEGLKYILKYSYEAVIVDIRLLPGENPSWRSIYRNKNQDTVQARLGLELLRTLLGHGDATLTLDSLPSWIAPSRFGILTVEEYSLLQDDFTTLGLPPSHYRQKILSSDKFALLELIKLIAA